MKRWLAGWVMALALVSTGASAAGASTASASVSRRDTASTKTFIALQERYDTGAIRRAAAVNAAEDAVVATVRSGCPNVLEPLPKTANAHQSKPLAHFLTEVLLTLNVEQLAPLRGLTDRVGDQMRRLRFSAPALQWQVNVDGSALRAYVDLRPPDLCDGAQVLAASHFTKTTAAGTRFVKDASTLVPLAASTGLLRQMRPYAPGPVSAALTRLAHLERTVDHKLAFGRHLQGLLRALGASHVQLTSSGVAA